MANRLKMAKALTVLTLREQGWSYRRIARELGIDRDTVRRHVQQASGQANAAKAPPGSQEANAAKAPLGSVPLSERSRSHCEPFRELILAKLQQGLTAQRIWQDLKQEHHFTDRYWSVRRFILRLGQNQPLPFRRMECAPGDEAQVDFGSAAPVVEPDGRKRRPHVFRIVLSHSRKAYSEAVWRQTTDEFIRCLENAFAHFGGVPRTLVIDNLRAAVTRADWFDPELTPKIQAFARHYGTAILPTKPYTPRHKGKIENGVGYVKSNALRGRSFSTLEEQNQHLLNWETTVADTRLHGTTRQQVGRMFREAEKPALLPLPPDRFPCFQEGRRSVHRDGHVEVQRAYYSVPPEYLGREVWVRWDGRLVRLFNEQMTPIAVHVQREPGRFSTLGEHIVARKISGIEKGATWLLERASHIGPQAGQWAEQMLQNRGIEGMRALLGLISLAERHSRASIELACQTARSHGSWHLRTIRALIGRRGEQQDQFHFMDQHPIIRSLSDYGQVVRSAFNKEPWA